MLKFLCCLILLANVQPVSALKNNFNIAASYDDAVNVITLRWHNDDPCMQFYILQKSDDEEDWTNLDTLYDAPAFLGQEVAWEYRSPVPGGSSYRIKAVIDELNFDYSEPLFVKGKPSTFEWEVEDILAAEKLTL